MTEYQQGAKDMREAIVARLQGWVETLVAENGGTASMAACSYAGARVVAATTALPERKVDVNLDNWQRFPDGTLKPFLSPHQYNELRDDDRFLYNCGPKPEGLI